MLNSATPDLLYTSGTMIILYINPQCPYCKKTLAVAHELGVHLNLQDVHHPEMLADLIRLGGKRQFPFMVDDVRDVSMYESDDIIAYLREHYSTT